MKLSLTTDDGVLLCQWTIRWTTGKPTDPQDSLAALDVFTLAKKSEPAFMTQAIVDEVRKAAHRGDL